jgi:hypothetical protein
MFAMGQTPKLHECLPIVSAFGAHVEACLMVCNGLYAIPCRCKARRPEIIAVFEGACEQKLFRISDRVV